MSKENAQEFSFVWKIHNFSFAFYKNGDAIDSPIFEIDSFGGSQWCLTLYPNGETKAEVGYVSIFLRKKKNDIYSDLSSLIYELELFVDDGKKLIKHEAANHDYKLIGSSFGFKRYIAIITAANAQKKWPKCVLIFRCNMFNTRKQRCLDFVMHSEISVNRSLFLWNVKILDISSQPVSKEFSFSEKSLYEITLSMPDDVDAIKICIHQKEEDSPFPKFVECKLSLVNSKKNELTSKRASHLFEPNDKSDIWEFPTFITKDLYSKSDICENGIFSLFCEIVASDGIKSSPVTTSKYGSTTNEDNHTALQEDLKSMLRNHVHSDIKLRMDDEVIHAHKSILATRSPVFSAMFERDMIESQTGIVGIPDLEANVFKVFLEFIYTGSVVDFDFEKARKLFVVADKYQVQSLTEKCVNFLEAILSLGNAIEILSLADMLNHEQLKTTAMHYIARNSEVIFKTPEWQDLIRENIKLASEMLSIIAANYKIVINN